MKKILDRAIIAMKNASIDDQQVENAAARVFEKLQADHNKVVSLPGAERISGCADFQALMPAYLTQSLTEKKAMLLEDHTRECVVCRNALKSVRSPYAGHERQRAGASRRGGLGTGKLVLVAAAAMLTLVVGLGQMNAIRDYIWPIDVSAVAQTVDGNLFLVADSDVKPIVAGQKIERSQRVRTGIDSGAILQLADGSKIEMRQRSELWLNRANDGVQVQLDRGSVIVTAAKQRSGHLYVATDDCTVSVVGTVFSVNTGAKGSRVSVLEGEVHVEQGETSKAIYPGQQHATNPALGTVSLEQDIAWSREADIHRELIRELVALQRDLGTRIAAQELRYSSNLLALAPPNTVLVASLPNLTESFGQAYETFRQRVIENATLRPWWEQQSDRVTMDELITRVRTVGSYLGEEILIVVQKGVGSDDGPILLAETRQPEALRAAVTPFLDEGLTIRIESGLFIVAPSAAIANQVLALRQSPATNTFASSRLYARIATAYQQGVGWLAAADLNRILSDDTSVEAAQLGIKDAQQLIIEQKTGSGEVAFHATIGFDQPRRGVVSWLAEPGPIGALEFVSPKAYGAVAVATKDPAQIVEDLFGFLSATEPGAIDKIAEMQRVHRIDVRHDLAEPLGGEFLFAVDGPLLPTPAWKVVVEVYDAARLQNTIQWVLEEYNREAAVNQLPPITLTSEMAGGRTFYVLSAKDSPQIHYTFSSGYLLAGPNRTLLTEAIQYKESGSTLARSEAFRSQIPADGRDYVSGFFYQNVSSAVPTAGMFGDLVPTLICLYGEPDRIALSSKGVLGMNLGNLAGLMQQVGGAGN